MSGWRERLADRRKAAGERIDSATAEVWFVYARVLDPYGELNLEPELQCVGREWFACNPGEQIAVSFHDLPEATVVALRGKRDAADREGWEQILSARFR